MGQNGWGFLKLKMSIAIKSWVYPGTLQKRADIWGSHWLYIYFIKKKFLLGYPSESADICRSHWIHIYFLLQKVFTWVPFGKVQTFGEVIDFTFTFTYKRFSLGYPSEKFRHLRKSLTSQKALYKSIFETSWSSLHNIILNAFCLVFVFWSLLLSSKAFSFLSHSFLFLTS